jgi:choline dehydrogenase-like flavoprotein
VSTRPRSIRNKARRYAFFYHAEQAPNPASTVSLIDACDALGMKRLRVDLRYGDADAASVVAAHAIIDRNLRDAGIGRLEYHCREEERAARVREQMTDGYHQIGTIRMSTSPAQGVVDADCRVHGTPNLFVAGSAVFPTSGQANPTLLITALSARLASHVARLVRDLPEPRENGHTQFRERPAPASVIRPSFTPEPHAAPVPMAG